MLDGIVLVTEDLILLLVDNGVGLWLIISFGKQMETTHVYER